MSQQKPKHKAPSFFHSRVISIISIAMVLFLLGIVSMMTLIGNGLKDYVRESVNFTILLSPDATDVEVRQMRDQLTKEPFVKEVAYFSKEQAMEELQKELGENPEEFLGWNPLSPTFEVQLHAAYVSQRDSIAVVEKRLSNYKLTESLSYRSDLVEEINSNIQTLSVVMLVAALLLLVISVVLINNTIRLLIYSKRFTIYTMKLVGATNGFIRRPFVRYNIWSGVMAALLAIALLAWATHYLVSTYPMLAEVFTPTNLIIVAGIVLVAGILISWVSAALAVSKYLRMDMNKLYRV